MNLGLWQELQFESRLHGPSPLIVQRGMMVSHIIDNYAYSPARAHAHCAQLLQELEAGLGIESPGLAGYLIDRALYAI
jgi:hypothetical protein